MTRLTGRARCNTGSNDRKWVVRRIASKPLGSSQSSVYNIPRCPTYLYRAVSIMQHTTSFVETGEIPCEPDGQFG